MKRSFLTLLSIMALLVMIPSVSIASKILIGDENSRIGLVDTTTGDVSGWFDTAGVGSGVLKALSDIAYDPFGNLWGITLHGLYSIDTTAGSATPINSFGSSVLLNALTFGSNGTPYAMGLNSTDLYTLDLASGAATSLGSVGFISDGDLAFDNKGSLYLSATPGLGGTNSRLVQIDATTLSASLIGTDLGMEDVYGLSFTDGIMFGAAGTKIFEINLSTGTHDTNSIKTIGSDLSIVYGASGPETVPGPATPYTIGGALPVVSMFFMS